jgi:thiamine biosynthesis protein ThiS
MRLLINGTVAEVAEGPSLGALIQSRGLAPNRVAAELNGSVIPRREWDNTQVNEGDRIELVHFVGGG